MNSKANLGPGLYVWDSKETAAAYLDRIRSLAGDEWDESKNTKVREFTIGESDLGQLDKLDLRTVGENEFQNFIDTHTSYSDDPKPHGRKYVIYPRNAGDEHYFDKSVFQLFEVGD